MEIWAAFPPSRRWPASRTKYTWCHIKDMHQYTLYKYNIYDNNINMHWLYCTCQPTHAAPTSDTIWWLHSMAPIRIEPATVVIVTPFALMPPMPQYYKHRWTASSSSMLPGHGTNIVGLTYALSASGHGTNLVSLLSTTSHGTTSWLHTISCIYPSWSGYGTNIVGPILLAVNAPSSPITLLVCLQAPW